MAITSYGYTGAVNNVQWAGMAGSLGFDYVAKGPNDCKASAVGSATRTVRIAAGVIAGGGVIDYVSTPVDIALPNVTTGSRWYLIVAERTWQTTNATVFTYVAGTGVKQIPGRTTGFGTKDQQPIALVRIAAGQSIPAEVVDLRVVGSNNGVMIGFDALALQYLDTAGTVVRIGGVDWTRSISSSGALVWEPDERPGAWQPISGVGGWSAPAGGAESPRMRRVGDEIVGTGLVVRANSAATIGYGGMLVGYVPAGMAPEESSLFVVAGDVPGAILGIQVRADGQIWVRNWTRADAPMAVGRFVSLAQVRYKAAS